MAKKSGDLLTSHFAQYAHNITVSQNNSRGYQLMDFLSLLGTLQLGPISIHFEGMLRNMAERSMSNIVQYARQPDQLHLVVVKSEFPGHESSDMRNSE